MRIKPAPNRGYHFVSPSAPFSLRGISPFPVPENPPLPPPFLWEVLVFLQDLLYESIVFSHREIRDKRWRETVDLNSVHVWFSLRFCLGFSWRVFLHTFSHKTRRRNLATKSAKESGSSKIKRPTRKPRHASVFSTHSDTQAVPAFHCIRMSQGSFRHASVFKTHQHAVYQYLQKPPTFFDTLAFLKRAFRHARVRF